MIKRRRRLDPDDLDMVKKLGGLASSMDPESPLGRLRRSAMQPGNTLASKAWSGATRGEAPFDPGMAEGSKNFWDATIKDIMFGMSGAQARVPTVNVDTGRGIAVEDPRMFSDELRDTIIANRKAAGLDERGRPEYSRYVSPGADEPGEPGFLERGDSKDYFKQVAKDAGVEHTKEYWQAIAEMAGFKSIKDMTPEQLRRAQQRFGGQSGFMGLVDRGWRSPR